MLKCFRMLQLVLLALLTINLHRSAVISAADVVFRHDLHDVVCANWMYLLCLLSLLVLGRLCGFVQSKPGAALDDPWPTGRVKGSAWTPLPIHVSHTHTHFVHMLNVWIQLLLLFYSQFQSSHRFVKHKIEEANMLPNYRDIQEMSSVHSFGSRLLSSNMCCYTLWDHVQMFVE